MILAGQNLYRVVYRLKDVYKLKDEDFQKLAVAFSEKEALAYFKDVTVVKVSLVENDISMLVPDHYVQN